MGNRVTTSPADELQYVAELLARDWVLAMPTAVASVLLVAIVFASVLSVIASALIGHAAGGHVGAGLGLGSGLLIGAVMFAIGLVLLYITQAMVMAAAPAAFAGERPNLGPALRVTLARLPQLLALGAIGFALAIVPMALSLVLVGIPLLFVLGYLLMFAPAAVIVGNENAVDAVKTSFRLTTQRAGESFICWLGTILAFVAGAVANGIAMHFPILNLVAGFAIGGFTSAYAALLGVRFYLALRDVATPRMQTAPPASYGGPPSIIR